MINYETYALLYWFTLIALPIGIFYIMFLGEKEVERIDDKARKNLRK